MVIAGKDAWTAWNLIEPHSAPTNLRDLSHIESNMVEPGYSRDLPSFVHLDLFDSDIIRQWNSSDGR